MSDTEQEEDNYCFYGTPLDPYDEDTFPKRKPIGIEEQVATDAQGRRRFHGAFTGGFSAGFFNTVGTPEGWIPTEFKSSRADKASSKLQKPQDFMDDEDMGEFGFAPETVKATDEFSTSKKKRKKQPFSTGPIPGVPVLHSLLEVHCETIGYTLMRNMGWKVGAGESDAEEDAESPGEGEIGQKVYGCVIPKQFRMINSAKFTIGASALKTKHPYDEFIAKPKDNSFGMGYSGLDRSIFGHVNLLEPSKLVVREKKGQRRSTIRGQAFGVGAFEQEDEDIYRTDDMTRYDFTLEESPAKTTTKATKAIENRKDSSALDKFTRATIPFVFPSNFLPPSIPHSFTGKHKVKRSRFEPLPVPAEPDYKKIVHDAETRAELLREHREKQKERFEKAAEKNAEARKKNLEMLFGSDRFVSGSDSALAPEKTLQTFAEATTSSVTPEPEQSPFFRDRFVSAGAQPGDLDSAQVGALAGAQPGALVAALVQVSRSEHTHGTPDMRRAAEMKMFGPLTRTASSWNPNAYLCKKFNVPPPVFDGSAEKGARKRTKLLIFEYQKAKDADGDLKPGLTETKAVPETPEVDRRSETGPVPEPVQEEKAPEIVKSVSLEPEKVMEVEEKQEEDVISPEKNMDLFKAVFLSSSEEEDDSEKEEDNDNEKEDPHLETITKEITEVTFPKIVPKKIGILSNICFTKPSARLPVPTELQVTNPDTTKVGVPKKSAETNLYGPQLPANCNYEARTGTSSNNFAAKIPLRVDDEEWIEKGDVEKPSSKKSDSHKHKKKKHKKDDEKKKHKSKHKKHKKDKR